MSNKKKISAEDCDEWMKNKNINPITKKKISDNGIIYKNLLNQCDIENKIKTFCTKITEEIANKDHKYYIKIKDFCDDIFNHHYNHYYQETEEEEEKEERKKEKEEKKEERRKRKEEKEERKKKKEKKEEKRKEKEERKKKVKIETTPLIIDINKSDSDINEYSSSIIDICEKERYKKYVKMMDYLKNINLGNKGCIEPANKKNTYTLNKDIGLYKQIGSNSAFGAVYKSVNINEEYLSKNIPKFVTKIQVLSNVFKSEFKILKIIMEIIKKDNIPLFPLIYDIIKCDNLIKDKNYPKPLQKATGRNKSYTLILYELATGDLSSFFKKERNYNLWKNCYEQIFMSLFIFHSIIKNIHGDAHYGNFLYRKIKPGGCFCYNINGTNYYIENLGYVWMVWDYSNATPLKELSDYIWIEDFMRINRFMRKRDLTIEKSNFYKQYIYDTKDEYQNRFGYLDDSIKIPNDIYKLQEQLAEHIYYKCYKKEKLSAFSFFTKMSGSKEILTEYEWFKMILDNNLLFSKTPIGEIISTTYFTNPNKFYYTDKLTY